MTSDQTLYLLDANVLIDAHNKYYRADMVPEFWEWMMHCATSGTIAMPLETFEEVRGGADAKRDLLNEWVCSAEVEARLVLKEEVYPQALGTVMDAYAPDLNDNEVEQVGRDPFLVAYGLVAPALGLLVAVLLVLVQAALHKWLLNSITRFLPFFLTGICLALFQGAITRQVNAMSATRIELAVAGALLVVALCPVNDSRGLEAGTIAIPLLAVAAAVLIACGERSRIFRTLLGNRVLISIGMASFSLYIWQQLFFSPAAAVPWTARLNLPLALGLAALCGTASYLLIEKNAQRLRLRSEGRRRGLLDRPG